MSVSSKCLFCWCCRLTLAIGAHFPGAILLLLYILLARPFSQIYYHYLAIELREICRQRHIPYVRLDSFPEAVVSYHRHLYQMGRQPDSSQKQKL